MTDSRLPENDFPLPERVAEAWAEEWARLMSERRGIDTDSAKTFIAKRKVGADQWPGGGVRWLAPEGCGLLFVTCHERRPSATVSRRSIVVGGVGVRGAVFEMARVAVREDMKRHPGAREEDAESSAIAKAVGVLNIWWRALEDERAIRRGEK